MAPAPLSPSQHLLYIHLLTHFYFFSSLTSKREAISAAVSAIGISSPLLPATTSQPLSAFSAFSVFSHQRVGGGHEEKNKAGENLFKKKTQNKTKNPAGIGALGFEYRQIKLMAEVGERHGCVCTRARALLQLL